MEDLIGYVLYFDLFLVALPHLGREHDGEVWASGQENLVRGDFLAALENKGYIAEILNISRTI